jgi:hypothetical protein
MRKPPADRGQHVTGEPVSHPVDVSTAERRVGKSNPQAVEA